MTDDTQVKDVPVRDAATVMVVRDGEPGMEVFLLRRSMQSVFLGGAYVFPGGAVDDADRHADLEAVCEGRTDAEASALLGVERGGLAFWVAAIRECFEEAGVLLAYEAASRQVVRLGEPEVAARFVAHRQAVDRGERRLVDVCAAEGLRLAVDGMHYVSHWVTPEGAPRRYDTRFFVAAAPAEQEPVHDDRETVAQLWITPDEALDRHADGQLELMLPTFKNLQMLSRFATTADLFTSVEAAGGVPSMQPRLTMGERGVQVLLPGDPGYEDAVLGEDASATFESLLELTWKRGAGSA